MIERFHGHSLLASSTDLVPVRISRRVFDRTARLCRLSEHRRAGRVRTGRGVVQYHLPEGDLGQVSDWLKPYLPASWRALTAWVSLSGPGAYHNWHWHTGCERSLILYLDDAGGQPGRCGQTVFQRRLNDPSTVYVQPQRQLMLCFDARLRHRTMPIVSGCRRSLAIDFSLC